MIEILEHHAFNIRIQYGGCIGYEEIKRIANQDTVRLSRLCGESGERVYPNLEDKNGRDTYIEAKISMVKALKEGSAIIIPDINSCGEHNADMLCELCGNRKENKCELPSPPYIRSVK